MENDKAELAKYTFMGWLDEFIWPRKTKSNIEFIESNESLVFLTSSSRGATSKTTVMIKMTILIVTVFLIYKLLTIQLLKLLAKSKKICKSER